MRAITTAAFKTTSLMADVLAYVVELYPELTQENGSPTAGTQNQVVDFVLAVRN
ncbi:MAG: hypothetical protein JO081_03390 [Alphaproteobacteria bacterium]|nr:hypothetical protein [Alphaproteobacteria bacterium]